VAGADDRLCVTSLAGASAAPPRLRRSATPFGANMMKSIKHLPIVIVLIMIAGCKSQEIAATFDNPSSIERAIKSGQVGSDFAERAKKTGDLHVHELLNPGIPYKVFTFSDYQAGYSVLVETNHLVLLCAGFGGGAAKDLVIKKEDGKEVLLYHFDVGSGVSHELSGRYVLGSGRARWDVWDKKRPPHKVPADAAEPRR